MLRTKPSPSATPASTTRTHLPPGKFLRMSLRMKVNLVTFVVLAALLITTIVVLNQNVSELMNRVGQQQIREEARAAEVQFQKISRDLLKETRLLATAPQLVSAVVVESTDEAETFLTSTQISEYFTDIAVFTRAGEQIFASHGHAPPSTREEQDLIAAAARGTEHLAVLKDEVHGLRLAAAAPIHHFRTFRTIGVLVNSLPLDTRFLKEISLESSHVGLFVIFEGRIYAINTSEEHLITSFETTIAHEDTLPEDHDQVHTDTHVPAFDIILAPEALAQALTGEIYVEEQPVLLHGTLHMAAAIPLIVGGQPAAVVRMFIGLDEFIMFQQQFTTRLAVTFGVLGTIALGVMFLFIRTSVTRRLRDLQRVAEQMTAGHYDQRVRIASSDEIGQLGLAFNTMSHQLGNLYNTLEARIVERTTQLENALALARDARNAAEQANAMKSQFLANMSHELRTPLNAIINFTYMLHKGMYGPVTLQQQTYLERVRSSGQHLLNLINDILDLSKIEAGRMTLSKESVQLDELIRSAMSTAVGLTKDKPIQLHHEIEDNLPTLEADPTRLRQLLLNLLSNAAKFTDQGDITVRACRDGNQIVLSVQDTGIGIPHDKREAIFQEFRQADEGSARSYQGTGLGLAICQRLVEMHSGRIWVESTLGVGSTFFVSLPLSSTRQPDSLEPLIPDTPPPPDAPRILVVDNDASAIDIIQTYLRRAGYAVYGLVDSRHTLNEARRLQPDVIILDILMPHQDGWEILSALKSDSELRHIPVLFYTIVEEEQKGLQLGASAYLLKPIDEQILRRTVDRLVAHDARVLIIDDDPSVREMIVHYLSSVNGYQVITADGGRTGLEAIFTSQPDLVILDLMMPEVDGFAVLAELDHQPTTRTLPVIILTAKDLSPDERTYLEHRVRGLLTKDGAFMEQLLHRVRQVARQERQSEPPQETQ